MNDIDSSGVLQRVTAALMMTIAVSANANAGEDVPDGALAGAIRSSGNPCAKVVDKSEGDSSWEVTCNAGRYQVTQAADGNFSVTPVHD